MKSFSSALWLLRDVSMPAVARHRARAIVTLLGVVIGVQVVVAINLLNRSVLHSFQHTVTTIAGDADLQVSNGSAGVPESLTEEVATIPGVQSAAPLVEGRIATAWGDLTLFGVDLLGPQEARATHMRREHVHIPDEYAFVSTVDSVAVATTFADRAGLGLGAPLGAIGPTGHATLMVRGLVDPVRAGALFGGAIGLMDLEPAQRLLGRNGLVDQIDVVLRADSDSDDVARRIARVLNGRGTVEPPGARAARLGGMLSSVQTVLVLVSLLTMVVGAFLAYHSLETAIVQRRRELALVRAIGYRRGTIAAATILEAVAFGLIASVAGALLGIGSAGLALRVVATGVDAIWARVDPAGLALTATDIVAAFAVGVGTALVASIVPAWRAARVSVIDQLADLPTDAAAASTVFQIAWGAVLSFVGFALLAIPVPADTYGSRILLIMGGIVLVALGYTAVAPLLATVALGLPRWIGTHTANAALQLATDNADRDAPKARGTIAALMLAFALVLIVNAFVLSLRGSLLTWVEQTLAHDLYVSPGHQLPLPSGPTLPASITDDLRGVPGIDQVSGTRMLAVRVGDAMTVLRTDTTSALRRQHYPILEGGGADFYEGFAAGTTVLISDNLAYRQDLTVGDRIVLATPSGRRSFRVGAIAIDYTLDIGSIVVEQSTFRSLWKDDLVNIIGLWLAPGADPERTRAAVARAVPPTTRAIVMSGTAFKQQIADALDQALLATQAVQLVAIAIAVLGVTNFFLAAMVDRRRESGLLRSVALNARQIRRLFAWEAGLLGLIGGLMALAYAWPVSYLLVTRATRMVSGWQLTFIFPGALAVGMLVVAAATSIVGAYYPVRQATRQPIATLVAHQ